MTDKITSSTMIPISVIAVIGGAAFWFSTMFVNLQSAEADIITLKRHQEDFRDLILANQSSIDRRLSKIEGKVNYIHKIHLNADDFKEK
jgi:hypothetical protein